MHDEPQAPTPSPDAPSPQCLIGRLERAKVDTGSKSERVALRLVLIEPVDGQGAMVLRRAGASPYQDLELQALEGQVLRVEGVMRNSYFLVQHYGVVSADPAADP